MFILMIHDGTREGTNPSNQTTRPYAHPSIQFLQKDDEKVVVAATSSPSSVSISTELTTYAMLFTFTLFYVSSTYFSFIFTRPASSVCLYVSTYELYLDEMIIDFRNWFTTVGLI